MAYDTELDDITQQAKTAQRLRDGVPGYQSGAAEAKIRLNGGDPAVGSALRSQNMPDNTALQTRLSDGATNNALRSQPMPGTTDLRARLSTGGALRNQTPADTSALQSRLSTGAANDAGAALRDQPVTDMSDLKNRLVSGQPKPAPAVPPRNVSLSPPISDTTTLRGTRFTTPNVSGVGNEAMFAQRSAAAAPAAAQAAPTAASALPEAVAESAPRTIGGVARSVLASPATGAAARAVGPAIEGVQVGQVALDPNMTKKDLLDQTGIAASRLAGAATGARLGGMVGSLGGTLGKVAGTVIGGVGGYMLADRSVSDIRKAIGLDPKTPFERSVEGNNAPQAGAGRGFVNPPAAEPGSAPANAPATPSQRPLPASSPAVPTTIAGAAQQAARPAAQPDSYELGRNAVEIIKPGEAPQTVVWRGGEQHVVDSNDYYGGRVNQVIDSRQRIADAARAAMERDSGMTDTERKQAVENTKNEGGLARVSAEQAGAKERTRMQLAAPHVIAPQRNPAAGMNGQPSVIDGSVFYPETGEVKPMNVNKPPVSQARAQALAALKAGAPVDAVNAKMGGYGYGTFSLDKKTKSYIYNEHQ